MEFREAIGKSFLLVCSEPEMKNVITGMLLKKGCEVAAANTMGNACKQIQLDTPYMVLVCEDKKGISGVELCRWLKQSGEKVKPPVIIISDRMDLSYKLTVYLEGAKKIIQKPTGPSSMNDFLERLVACASREFAVRRESEDDLIGANPTLPTHGTTKRKVAVPA